MSERLGDMLLHVGALTQAQLEEVLSAQSIYGGRLGTNLVEMGLVSEEDLARLLNEKLGVPSVDAASLERVPESVLAILSAEKVRRFQVLPIALDGKRLTLAMADPSDFSAIEELGFFTGMVIVPRVCSELRISLALERYYGIKRTLHFIPVSGGVRTRMINMTRENAGLGPSEARYASLPAPDIRAGSGTLAPSASRNAVQSSEQSSVKSEAQSAFKGATRDAVQSAFNGVTQSATRGTDWSRVGIEALAAKFAAASAEAEVVTALMSYIQKEFDRAGFLSLRRGSAVGVQAVTEGAVVSTFAGSVFGLENAALLKRVLQEKAPYLGKLPETGTEGQMLAEIGGRPGGAVLLLPLVIRGENVAFLLVEDENGRLGPGLFDLQRVVAKAELAFEMLGIRKKIGLV
jgi:hypothetical protein